VSPRTKGVPVYDPRVPYRKEKNEKNPRQRKWRGNYGRDEEFFGGSSHGTIFVGWDNKKDWSSPGHPATPKLGRRNNQPNQKPLGAGVNRRIHDELTGCWRPWSRIRLNKRKNKHKKRGQNPCGLRAVSKSFTFRHQMKTCLYGFESRKKVVAIKAPPKTNAQ